MRILVFETQSGGHYLHWAGQVAAALAHEGARVTLATSKGAIDSPSFALHIEPLREKFQVDAQRLVVEGQSPMRARLHALEQAVLRSAPDRLYLPTADGLAQCLALKGPFACTRSVPTEGLVMNGAVAHQQRLGGSSLKQRLSYELGRRAGFTRAFHLNPFVSEWEMRRGISPQARMRTMPEPVEPPLQLGRQQARARLNLSQTGVYFGMVGSVDRRKGADLLLASLRYAKLPPEAKLLLFGRVAEELKPEIDKAQRDTRGPSVIVRNELLSDEELLTTLEALDLVVLPYRRTVSSSGIVTRATACGRPVLTTGGGWAEEMIRRFKLGWTIPRATPSAIARGLEEHLSGATNWVLPAEATHFVKYNTAENFARHWVSGLREVQGLPPDPHIITWDSLISSQDDPQ